MDVLFTSVYLAQTVQLSCSSSESLLGDDLAGLTEFCISKLFSRLSCAQKDCRLSAQRVTGEKKTETLLHVVQAQTGGDTRGGDQCD